MPKIDIEYNHHGGNLVFTGDGTFLRSVERILPEYVFRVINNIPPLYEQKLRALIGEKGISLLTYLIDLDFDFGFYSEHEVDMDTYYRKKHQHKLKKYPPYLYIKNFKNLSDEDLVLMKLTI